ncbi:MAG: hypothetical protein ACP5N0_13575 [Methanosarcina sp.]|uniref:hypothetical protein n=1 Tax=Methanosarcina sp. TaxID=2213 RepID=UPI003BB6547C
MVSKTFAPGIQNLSFRAIALAFARGFAWRPNTSPYPNMASMYMGVEMRDKRTSSAFPISQKFSLRVMKVSN